MKYEIRQQRLVGSPYVKYSLWADGQFVHDQISPYSDDEIEARLASHVNPVAPAAPAGKKSALNPSIKGPRPKQRDWNREGDIE